MNRKITDNDRCKQNFCFSCSQKGRIKIQSHRKIEKEKKEEKDNEINEKESNTINPTVT